MLKIHETTEADGSLAPVSLVRLRPGTGDGEGAGEAELALDKAGRTRPLPPGALPAVMRRFAAPFDRSAQVREVAALDLGGGAVLRHVRHLDAFDVIARDYLVYEAPGREPACAMATTVAGALEHLARAASGD